MPTMNTVRFHQSGEPEVLIYEQVDRPAPMAGQVLVKVSAIGVNYADVMRRSAPDSYPVPSPLPYALGGEATGTIVELGAGVSPHYQGRRAIVFPGAGCYSDYVVVPVDRVFDLPEGLSDEDALALFVQGLTAAFVLRYSARLAHNETLLVQGAAGGVGNLAVQLGRQYGAGKIIGCASSPEKRALVERLGADLTVDYRDPAWPDQVRDFTQGKGVDVVMEMTGGTVAHQSISLLAPFGRSIIYGHSSGEKPIVDISILPPRNLSITGFYFRAFLDRADLVANTLQELATLVSTGRLEVQQGGKFPLSEAASAHRLLESRTSTGKLILEPDEQGRD
ncbi:zinc-binding dehydrogenase [Novosphingobium sp. AAP83]|uniref:quinone oxidoreductase family protein n=1 Tax=Novosphingobium sp. AAP83 TaxID=1523425 RepID=UPI0018D14995|nr:zinc-binding dehydrogenase [Novosphingobium sp. AAP83]